VAYNYILALQKGEDLKAFQLLEPHGAHTPATLSKFKMDFQWSPIVLEGSIEIKTVKTNSLGTIVYAKVIKTDERGSFFSTDYSTSNYRIELLLINSVWKIRNFDRCYQECTE
jgi:hypothetical protein